MESKVFWKTQLAQRHDQAVLQTVNSDINPDIGPQIDGTTMKMLAICGYLSSLFRHKHYDPIGESLVLLTLAVTNPHHQIPSSVEQI
jgi:hypothetical protein